MNEKYETEKAFVWGTLAGVVVPAIGLKRTLQAAVLGCAVAYVVNKQKAS